MSEHPFSRRLFLGGAMAAALFNIMKPALAQGSKENAKIKVGVIGLGGRGKMIAQMIQDHGGYQITAVADYFPEVAESGGEQFGAPKENRFSGLSGYRKLIASGVEAVFLETPPYCFPEHVAAAVEAGCHVYMAKPIACDVPGSLKVLEMAKQAKAKNKAFLIDFQTRTDPLIIEGINRVRQGEIGKIGLLYSLYSDESFSDPPLTDNVESRLQHLIWVNDDALGGSYLVNAGIHAVDMALWLAGAPPVSAVGASRVVRREPHGDSHDVYSLTFEFADGLILNHRGEHLRNGFGFHADCVAHCQDGYLETAYAGSVSITGISTGWRGGEVKDLYQRGARHNIGVFHDSIANGVYDNPTVEPGVNATLATLLGREAGLRRTRVTWDEMIKENRRLEPNLAGLKA